MNIFIPQVQLRTPFSPADDLFDLFVIGNSFNAGKKGAIVAIKVKVKVKVSVWCNKGLQANSCHQLKPKYLHAESSI